MTETMTEPAALAADRCVCCLGTVGGAGLHSGSWRYAQCVRCGHLQLAPLPSPDGAADVYDVSYFTGGTEGGYADYEGDAALHEANAAHRLKLLRRWTRGRLGPVVDVGCAVGFFLAAAARAGHQAFGVDVSPYAAGRARARFGLDVQPVLAACGTSGRTALAVTFFQSLEHMPRPDEALAAAAELLHPDGVLIIETWDRRSGVARLFGHHWHQISPPSVVHLFDRYSLTLVLGSANLEVQWIGRTGKLVSVGHTLGLLADKLPARGGVLRWLARGPLRHLGFRYTLGDLITVVASPRAATVASARRRPR